MRACSTTRFPSEFHPSRRSFRPHLARRCTRVLVEHIAPSTPHHLTKKREKTRILTTTTAKQILPRPPKRDSNRAPRWRPSYFAPSLSREKKTTTHHLFSSSSRPNDNGLYRSTILWRERELLLLSRERDFKRRTKRPEKHLRTQISSPTP